MLLGPKYGFFGLSHLLSVIFVHYSILPLDDWMDKGRPFPYYVIPMLIFAAYYSPLLTLLALLGDLVVNLRVLVRKDNFILERLEGLGNVPIYVILVMPATVLKRYDLYLAATLFILFVDSFHKIGHQERLNPKLMWVSGLICLFLVSFFLQRQQ